MHIIEEVVCANLQGTKSLLSRYCLQQENLGSEVLLYPLSIPCQLHQKQAICPNKKRKCFRKKKKLKLTVFKYK